MSERETPTPKRPSLSQDDGAPWVDAYRAAADSLDERPSAAVRAAILAAAAREVGAQPRSVDADGQLGAVRPHRRGASDGAATGITRTRWPYAAAASLLVGTFAVMLAARIDREGGNATAPQSRAQSTLPATPAAGPARQSPSPVEADTAAASAPGTDTGVTPSKKAATDRLIAAPKSPAPNAASDAAATEEERDARLAESARAGGAVPSASEPPAEASKALQKLRDAPSSDATARARQADGVTLNQAKPSRAPSAADERGALSGRVNNQLKLDRSNAAAETAPTTAAKPTPPPAAFVPSPPPKAASSTGVAAAPAEPVERKREVTGDAAANLGGARREARQEATNQSAAQAPPPTYREQQLPNRAAAAPAFKDKHQAPSQMSGAVDQDNGARTQRPTVDAADEDDPAAWLRRIEALRNAGRHVEADIQVQRFIARYPQINVPDALRYPSSQNTPVQKEPNQR